MIYHPNGGCIYLNADMVLTGRLGVVSIPDGISVHVDRRGECPSMENSIIAVDRNNHPALLAGLKITHQTPDAHSYYDGACKVIRSYFDCSINDNNSLCDFIEFKHDNIIINTSQFTQSSIKTTIIMLLSTAHIGINY